MSSPFRLRFNKTSFENLPLPARATRATYYDTEVLGLQLRVTDRAVKSFCVFRRSKRGSGDADISVVPVRMGLQGEIGVVVAGSERADFPTQTEGLLLRVAANQGWISLQEARLLTEQKRVARESIEDRKWSQTLLAGEKRLLEMIASGSPLLDVLNALCNFVEHAAPECYCGVYPIDWTGPTFLYGVAPSLPVSYIAPIEGLPVHCGIAPCGVAAYVMK